ncbi:hypothetical protein RchiOBHm_Chr1g0358831 [Rosa chinensis]|uniref:Uncharacterized protein n=1 Tax=Rosa chinensis TaxID=74649 RepID=A0A2P6SI77_ROSCH|nr:hypothetical protein RchiOBHm_Chr1g0358831 [Rosa chinensis]
MRRRRGVDMSFMSEVPKYHTCRKDVKKAINKASKLRERTSTDKTHETPAFVKMLKELDAGTSAMFESLFSFIAGSDFKSKSST